MHEYTYERYYDNKSYAFWKIDDLPYLAGGEVLEVMKDGNVRVIDHLGCKAELKPLKIVSLEKGIKLQKRIKRATAKYNQAVKIAESELREVIKKVSE